MELKNSRVGVLLEDYLLRRRLTDLLRRHCLQRDISLPFHVGEASSNTLIYDALAGGGY